MRPTRTFISATSKFSLFSILGCLSFSVLLLGVSAQNSLTYEQKDLTDAGAAAANAGSSGMDFDDVCVKSCIQPYRGAAANGACPQTDVENKVYDCAQSTCEHTQEAGNMYMAGFYVETIRALSCNGSSPEVFSIVSSIGISLMGSSAASTTSTLSSLPSSSSSSISTSISSITTSSSTTDLNTIDSSSTRQVPTVIVTTGTSVTEGAATDISTSGTQKGLGSGVEEKLGLAGLMISLMAGGMILFG